MSSPKRPPLWGNFVAYADEDLLAFGLLIHGGIYSLGYYHGVQAIEKYLKALVLSILDPDGITETPDTQRCLRTHNLVTLAGKCKQSFPYYSEANVINNLEHLNEFDQATRYPWVNRNLGNGFSSDDISIIGELCQHIRNDLPIVRDNYKLGMEVRGYFHGDKSKRDSAWEYYPHYAVEALRHVLPSINDCVGGWDNKL